jgi:anaerobic magnesium-protoporphyrin IX monomethyl ester cyclase
MKKISVVIPNYNGKNLLEEYFPSVISALKSYPGDSEIIIVENGSVDESVSFLSNNYPEVRILKNTINKGFGPAVNKGVREAKYDIVLLLNNDIRVEQDFINPLVRHFDDPQVFAVVSKSLVKLGDRVINESVTIPGFDGGLIFCYQPLVVEKTRDEIKTTCTNFHASGGFGAFDRNKFLELGGFDDIYHPFYYEDVDLSYQAWKRGWLILYEPDSVVYHRSHATSRKVATDSYINRIEFRNKFLLTWKNISDPVFVVSHLKWVLGMFIRSFRPSKKNERYLMRILISALLRLPSVISYRIRNEKNTKLPDNRIFYLAANRDTPNLKFDRLLSEDTKRSIGLNILLIDPPGYQKGLNLGLAYLAGSLKKSGYNSVDVLDLNNVFYNVSDERIVEFIKKRRYDIIGFSIKTPTYNSATRVSRIIKQQYPKAILIAGGPHVTLNYNEFMNENEEFDYAFIGEGDLSLIEFCKMLEAGKEYPVAGIYSRKLGDSASFKLSLIDKLDELPRPDFEVFSGYDFTDFEYLLVTSRGCPYKCTYCSVGMISGSTMRFRDVESVISELKWAKEKLNCNRFNVVDDNFTLDIKRAKRFCDRLIEEGLAFNWACGNGIRADRVDAELAQKMKKAGCNLVCVGVENADPVVFSKIKKGETLDDIKRGVHFLKDAGIEVIGFFIVGLPGDTKRSSEMALEFLKEARLDSARFGILLPYPKTEVYDILLKTGTFLKDYKEGIHFSDKLSPIFETKEFSAAEMVATYEKLYTKLRYFTFLMPQDITEMQKFHRIVKLLWKYDKVGVLKDLKKVMLNRFQ